KSLLRVCKLLCYDSVRFRVGRSGLLTGCEQEMPPGSKRTRSNTVKRILTHGILMHRPIFMHKRILATLTAMVAVAVMGAIPIRAGDTDFEVVKVRKNFYMIAGGGGNIGAQIGSDGVVLVNSGAASAPPQVLDTIKNLTALPIRYVIDVDPDP